MFLEKLFRKKLYLREKYREEYLTLARASKQNLLPGKNIQKKLNSEN